MDGDQSAIRAGHETHATPQRAQLRLTPVQTRASAGHRSEAGFGTSHRLVERFLTLFGGRRFNPPVSLQPAHRAERLAASETNIWTRFALETPHVVVTMGGAEGCQRRLSPDPFSARRVLLNVATRTDRWRLGRVAKGGGEPVDGGGEAEAGMVVAGGLV